MNNSRFARGRFLRLVDPKYNYSGSRPSNRTLPVIVGVFIWLILCVWLSSQAVKFNYEINEISKSRDKLKISNRTLEIKLQSMMSSEGIAKVAKEKYGFKDPVDRQVMIIKKEKGIMDMLGGLFHNHDTDTGRI